jgi:integrase
VIRSLGTTDKHVALRRLPGVKADVDRAFREAEESVRNPSVAAYRAVEEWRQWRAQTPPRLDPEWGNDLDEEGMDFHITSALEDDDRGERRLDPVERAKLLALLKRHEHGDADNPPLSLLFDRYNAERKLPPKTKLEWDGVLRRFKESVGGIDLPVRHITQAHIRGFKAALLATTGRTGKTLSPATVKKSMGALASVLSWGKREGYLTTNPAEGFTVATAKGDPEDRRLPYSADDLAKLFSREAVEARKGRPADEWLPWLALYTGARLEELGQLRVTDVRVEDGLPYLAIEGGNGKHLKTRSSRRRIPVHPELVRLGFLNLVAERRAAGSNDERLFPKLKATSLGSLTAAWSKWWGHHARKVCGIIDPRKTFHSFRHLWKDAARAVMPEEHHDAITGHSNGSVGRSYGTGVPLKVLAESVARIRFAGMEGLRIVQTLS